MDDDDSAFQFKDEQERRIYERMFLVGVGPAAFYRDACRLLTLDPPLTTTTHLVRRCLREIESAMRYVLRPIAQHLQPPVAEAASQKQKKKQSESKDNHLAEMRFILQTLSIDETDPAAQKWLRDTMFLSRDIHSSSLLRVFLTSRQII